MIIDLTHTITPEMPMYPGSAAPSIKPTGSLTRDGFRETQLTIASHTGTHKMCIRDRLYVLSLE